MSVVDNNTVTMRIISSFKHWIQTKIYYSTLKIQQELQEGLPEFGSCGKNVTFGEVGKINCPQCISIGDNVYFDNWIYLTAWDCYSCIKQGQEYVQHFNPQLIIGDNCRFGAFNHITAINKIIIGNGVLTGKWVTITDNSHGILEESQENVMPIMRPMHSKGSVIIEDNVWICDKATILPHVTIGEGAIIAANAVVTKDVPSFSIVAGNPAIVIRKL